MSAGNRQRHPLETTALLGALLVLLLGAGLSRLASGLPRGAAPQLTSREPIEQADRQLRRAGWQADGDPLIDNFDRELSGNELSSLRSCSGTGVGFCRYLYRRGSEHLELITVPSSEGSGRLHHWRLWSSSDARP
jgi:hypothetical protein